MRPQHSNEDSSLSGDVRLPCVSQAKTVVAIEFSMVENVIDPIRGAAWEPAKPSKSWSQKPLHAENSLFRAQFGASRFDHGRLLLTLQLLFLLF